MFEKTPNDKLKQPYMVQLLAEARFHHTSNSTDSAKPWTMDLHLFSLRGIKSKANNAT